MLWTKIIEEAEKLQEQMKTLQDEMHEMRDTHDKRISDNTALIEKNKEQTDQSMQGIKDKLLAFAKETADIFKKSKEHWDAIEL